MRILWVPQISSKSNDGEVLLNKDSNMSVLRNLLDSNFCEENEITIAFEFSKNECIIDNEILENFRCVFNMTRKFTNAYMERFCFDNQFYESLKDYNFDLVFVNEPTKVIPLRKIFNCKVVTYIHWLAFKNMPEIHLRQLEGINAADACFVNSYYVIDELKKRYGDELTAKLFVSQPSFRGEVLPLKNDCKNNFIYNHRLSSDSYYKKAFESLVHIMDKVEETIGKENMPVIYLTNPSGKKLEIERDYFKIIDLGSQEEYNEFLESNEISFHINSFFESEGMWSMSTVDCARTGNICFLPNYFGYAEIFDKDYFGYCENESDMAQKIILCLSNKNINVNNKCISRHSANMVGNELNKLLGEIVNE